MGGGLKGATERGCAALSVQLRACGSPRTCGGRSEQGREAVVGRGREGLEAAQRRCTLTRRQRVRATPRGRSCEESKLCCQRAAAAAPGDGTTAPGKQQPSAGGSVSRHACRQLQRHEMRRQEKRPGKRHRNLQGITGAQSHASSNETGRGHTRAGCHMRCAVLQPVPRRACSSRTSKVHRALKRCWAHRRVRRRATGHVLVATHATRGSFFIPFSDPPVRVVPKM